MSQPKKYKIRITRDKNATACFVSCALTSTTVGGAEKRVAFATWHDLRSMLSSVHCGGYELTDAERSLNEKGVAILPEVSLYDDQLGRLGFDPAERK